MAGRSHLSIGEVLSLLRDEFPDVTISKIRFLESQGLVDPERTPSGYRKFYDQDIERLRWVLRQQRDAFLPLKVIRGRLEGQGSLPLGDPADDTKGLEHQGKPTVVEVRQAVGELTHPRAAPALTANGDGGAGRARSQVVAGKAPDAGALDAGPVALGPQGAEGTEAGGSEAGGSEAGGSEAGGSEAGVSRAALGPNGPQSGQTQSEPLTDAPSVGAMSTDAPTPSGGGKGAASPPPANPGAAGGAPGPKDVGAPAPPGRQQAPSRRRRLAESVPGLELGGDGEEQLTLEELLGAAGVGTETVQDLERFGLIAAKLVAGVPYYSRDDAVVARLAAAFARHGVEARHLRAYKGAAEREAGVVQQVVMPLIRQRNPEARRAASLAVEELSSLGAKLRAVLLREALSELR